MSLEMKFVRFLGIGMKISKFFSIFNKYIFLKIKLCIFLIKNEKKDLYVLL